MLKNELLITILSISTLLILITTTLLALKTEIKFLDNKHIEAL